MPYRSVMLHALRWDDFPACAPGLAISPYFVPPGWRYPVHSHDFAEVQVLVGGRMDIDGEVLESGDVQLLMPGQCHSQLARTACHGWVLLIQAAVCGVLTTRYAGDAAWPFRVSGPTRGHLGESERVIMARQLGELRHGGGMVARDAVLLSLARALTPGHDPCPGGPAWLNDAAQAFADGARMDEGVAGLVSLCGRSREHVSRILRTCCASDARSLVRELRLRAAERRIAAGEGAAVVAAECGFVSYAHFVTAFRRRFGCAPGQVQAMTRL